MKTLRILVVLGLFALFSCGNKHESAATPPEQPVVEQPKPAPAAAEVAAADVPTTADFEQQALDEINAQNIETELDKLEKDIGE